MHVRVNTIFKNVYFLSKFSWKRIEPYKEAVKPRVKRNENESIDFFRMFYIPKELVDCYGKSLSPMTTDMLSWTQCSSFFLECDWPNFTSSDVNSHEQHDRGHQSIGYAYPSRIPGISPVFNINFVISVFNFPCSVL